MEYRQVGSISAVGAATLRGLCIDRQDRLFVAAGSEVLAFDPKGVMRGRWNTARPALSVGVADDGSVYVGEPGQIEIFETSGKPATTWRDAERPGDITSIGFARDSVLAGDAKARCIRRFDNSGKLLNNIGKDGRMGGLLIPNGVVDFGVDAAGIVHAANPGKHRVERYRLDGELLGHIGRFDGIDPEGFPGCCNPTNIAVGPRGIVFVTEKAGPRAKVLDAEGKLVAVIASDVFDPNCKNMDVAVDSRGRVFVADTVRLQVLVFAPAAEGRS